MGLRFFITLAIILLAEYYSFIVVQSSVRNMSPAVRISLMSVYLFFTCVSWLGLILFRQVNWANVPHLLRNIYIAFVLGFMVGKILILIVMLVDDIRRLVTWLITSLAYSNTADKGAGNTI